MIYPAPLKQGATVGLIAPCSPISSERLIQCIETISSYGFHVALGESTTNSLHGYLAGSDEIRAHDINTMFSNPTIDAIFCLRGGYGSTRIMKLLNYKMIQRNPKIFVGYSDVTSFHLAFHSLCRLVTFHGPMVSSNMVDDFDEYTKESFFSTIGMPCKKTFNNPVCHPYQILVHGCAKGRIIGGCLSLVSPAVGTFYQPNYRGKILFLEDVEESLPRCDKLMQQLLHSGVLDCVNGIILGNFLKCTNPNDPSYTIYDYFKDFFQNYKKPVIYDLQSGHEKPMGTIPFGTICSLDTTRRLVYFHYC